MSVGSLIKLMEGMGLEVTMKPSETMTSCECEKKKKKMADHRRR